MYDATQEQIVKDCFQITFYIIGVLANLCLIFVLWKNPLNRFRNSPSYIISNLAIANVIAATGGMGETISIFTNVTDKLKHDIWRCIGLLGQQSAFLLIAILAIDRYLAISHPYRYNTLFRQQKFGVILNTTAWVITIIIIPTIIFGNFKSDRVILLELYVAQLCFLAMLTITLYPLNYLNFTIARKKLKSSPNLRQRSVEDLQLSQRLSQTCLIVSVFAIIFATPYLYFLIILLNKCFSCIFNAHFVKFYSYYRMLFPITFLINPFIYGWRLPLYRKSLESLLKKCLARMPCLRRTSTITGTNDVYIPLAKNNNVNERQQTSTETTSPV